MAADIHSQTEDQKNGRPIRLYWILVGVIVGLLAISDATALAIWTTVGLEIYEFEAMYKRNIRSFNK